MTKDKSSQTAKAADDTGAMIALYVPTEVGQRLALPNGEPVSELHLTLAYLGDMDEVEENRERLKQFVAEFSATHYLQPARIGGIGRFNQINSDGAQAVYATVDIPNLPGFRQELVSGAQWAADVEPSRDYGFVPHVTLAYIPAEAPMPIQNIEPLEFQFKRLSLTIGPERFDYDLVSEAQYINTAVSTVGMTIKAGARNSAMDMGRIQGAHDLMCELGAKCAAPSNVVYPSQKAKDPNVGGGVDRSKLKDSDFVFPDTRTFPVVIPGDVNDAVSSWGRYQGEHSFEDFQKRLTALCQRKGEEFVKQLPEKWKDEKEGKKTTDALAGAPVPPADDGTPSSVTANALKAISQTDDQLVCANYLALWNGRDLEGVMSANKNADGSNGEFFTPYTQFESDYTAIGRLPVDWEHGHDPDQDNPAIKAPGKDDVLGYVDWGTAKADGNGLWVQRVLNRRNKYVQLLETLVKAGLIGTSSEAITERVSKKANGEIERWPLRRDTLTVSPMEPRMMDQNTLQALKSLAGEVPAIKAACERWGIATDEKGRSLARLRLKTKQLM